MKPLNYDIDLILMQMLVFLVVWPWICERFDSLCSSISLERDLYAVCNYRPIALSMSMSIGDSDPQCIIGLLLIIKMLECN